MKKNIILLVVLLLYLNVFSQKIKEIKGTPGLRSVFETKGIKIDKLNFDINKSGKQTWNFSKLKYDYKSQTNFIEPQNTPYFKYFPEANYCFFTTSNQNSFYNFQKIYENGEYKDIGSVSIYDTITYISKDIYSDFEINNKLKISNDTSISSSKDIIKVFINDINQFHKISNYSYKTIINSYGKIKLPNKTYNSFKINYKCSKIDSLFYEDELYLVDTNYFDMYSWYTIQKGILILLVNLNVSDEKYYFEYIDKMKLNGMYKLPENQNDE